MPATTPFPDAEEFFEGPLELPIRGKTYTIPEVDIELGILLATAAKGEKSELDNQPTRELYRRLLGPVWDELQADKVPGGIMIRVGETALADFTQGREMARAVWEHGISPEALAAKKAATRKTPTDRMPKQASKTRSTRSRSTAAASGTPSPASTSGTSSPTATKPDRDEKAPQAGR